MIKTKIRNTAVLNLFLIVIFLSSGCTGSLGSLPDAEPCGEGGKCPEGFACDTDNKCHVCGNADGRVCCEGFKCEEGLICKDTHCAECGSQWKYCCQGNYCNEGCECVDDRCHCCGWVGEVCCEGNTCNDEQFYCGPDGKCHNCLHPNDSKEFSMACVSRG